MRSGRIVLLLVCLTAATSLASAQQSVPPSETIVERARRLGPVRTITLRETIEEALTQNLNVTLQSYSLESNRIRLKGLRGFYDPGVAFSAGRVSSVTPGSSLLDAGADALTSIPTEASGNLKFGVTVSQNIPAGGALNVNFRNSRDTTNSPFAIVNPAFNSSLTLDFTQPLLRGFRTTANRHQTRVVQADAKISESQFRQTVSDIVLTVHAAYWNLVLSLDNHEARRQSRDIAVVQQSATQQRVDGGFVTPVALTSDRAEVALRQQDLIQAELDVTKAQNALRQILAPSVSAAVWQQFLIPSDRPQQKDLTITFSEALDRAFKNRPEMEQMKLKFSQNAEDRAYEKNQTLPSVNLNATTGSIGVAGVIYEPIFGSGLTPIGRAELRSNPGFGGYGTALKQLGGFQFPSWSVALNVQVPIGNHEAQAALAEVQLNARRLQTQSTNLQQAIIVEVRNAFESLQLQRQGLDAARAARALSEEQLEGETERSRAGLTTNFELLRYQRDLTDARVRELRSQVDYQIAVSTLQHATDEIIDANDLILATRK